MSDTKQTILPGFPKPETSNVDDSYWASGQALISYWHPDLVPYPVQDGQRLRDLMNDDELYDCPCLVTLENIAWSHVLGFDVESYNKGTIEDIRQHIDNGQPVIVPVKSFIPPRPSIIYQEKNSDVVNIELGGSGDEWWIIIGYSEDGLRFQTPVEPENERVNIGEEKYGFYGIAEDAFMDIWDGDMFIIRNRPSRHCINPNSVLMKHLRGEHHGYQGAVEKKKKWLG